MINNVEIAQFDEDYFEFHWASCNYNKKKICLIVFWFKTKLVCCMLIFRDEKGKRT